MKDICKPVLVEPSIQNYTWGDPEVIPKLLNIPLTGEPVAEAWFGAHPAAPAKAITEEGEVALNRYIAQKPDLILGDELQKTYGALPYLIKILAARQPLSIQVHPNRRQAQSGYAEEERAGIPIKARHRSYRDPNHKPELMVALSPFYALAGFRPYDQIQQVIETFPELGELIRFDDHRPDGLKRAIQRFFELSEAVVQQHLRSLVARLEALMAEGLVAPYSRAFWLLRAHEAIGSEKTPDPGLVFFFLLELHALQPGQAIFLPAGILHSYLSGTGVEMMANSDNVLRAGLTSKYINIPELLNIVRFDAWAPPLVEPAQVKDTQTSVYPMEAEELRLERLSLLPSTPIRRKAHGLETVLVTAGDEDVWVHTKEHQLALRAGQAGVIPHDQVYAIESEGAGEVLIASTPPSSPATATVG